MYTDSEIKKAMRNIILCQCLGLTAPMMFSNNFLLSYLKELNCEASQISFLTSLPSMLHMILALPFAFAADRIGKKLLGSLGGLVMSVSFILLLCAGLTDLSNPFIWAFFIVYSIGLVMFDCTWFGLLSTIIPTEVRGRFFGKLRISWQIVGIILTLIITTALKESPGRHTFLIIIGILIAFLILRLVPYLGIPESKESQEKIDKKVPLKEAFHEIIQHRQFIKYCVYQFFTYFVISKIIMIFGLMQKEVLNQGDDQVVFMGNIVFIGSVAGFFLGGRLADRIGNYKVFLSSHTGFTLVLFLVPLRSLFDVSPIWLIGIASFFFGLFSASYGIAQTSELFALIPTRCRALSTTVAGFAATFGITLASVIIAFMLEKDLFPAALTINGNDFRYDFLLVILGLISLLALLLLKFTSLLDFYRHKKAPGKH